MSKAREWHHTSSFFSSQASQAQPTSQAQPSSHLFDRDFERETLRRYVKQPPSKILCLLGPRNCGKSALVRWFVSEEGPLKDMALLYNCRYLDTSSPQEFARTALQVRLPRLFSSPDSMMTRLRALLSREGERRGKTTEEALELFLPT
jgi:hypothetical protein